MSLFTLIAFAFLCAALYYICPLRLRWILLLLVSYGYYAYCGLSALPYILTTTLSTWAGALLIGRVGEQSKAYLREHKAELDAAQKKAHKAKARSRQRALFFAVLLLNFGILAVLKYMSPLLSWGASLAGKTAPALTCFCRWASASTRSSRWATSSTYTTANTPRKRTRHALRCSCPSFLS